MATIGYLGKLSQGGTPTVLTEAACTLVSGKTYQINAVANRVLDPNTAIVVNDTGVNVAAANILNVNAMNGKVTFVAAYTPNAAPPVWTASTAYALNTITQPTPGNGHVYKVTTAGTSAATQPTWPTGAGSTVVDGTVTWTEVGLVGISVSGKYIPRTVIASVKGVKSTPKNDVVDVTSVNQTGYVMRLPSVQDWSGSFDIFDYASNQGFAAIVSGRTPCLLDYDPTSAGTGVTRGWVVLKQSSGDVEPKSPIMTSVQFDLYDQSATATALSGFTVIASFAVATT